MKSLRDKDRSSNRFEDSVVIVDEAREVDSDERVAGCV